MPKKDITDELIASLHEAVEIMDGRLAPGRVHHVPDVDVRAARDALGMSQAAFSATFGVPASTLKKWEQGQRRPHGPARILLQVIAHEPEAVRRALAAN